MRANPRLGRALVGGCAAGAVALAACSSGPVVRLDGSPREPDAEGIVVKATRSVLTLDGNRTYKVSPKLIAFSTYNRTGISLFSTASSYVQIGVKKDTVVWLARIGVVDAHNPAHPVTNYQGDLVRVEGHTLTFKDGTVLRLDPKLRLPKRVPLGFTPVVTIDDTKHVVQGMNLPAPKKPTTTTAKP